MPRIATPLTDTQIKRTKPAAKLAKLFDGEGLYLEILPNGSKTWRFRYKTLGGNERVATFGRYPEVGLAEARDRRQEARRLLHDGHDPVDYREQQRRLRAQQQENSFKNIAVEWHTMKAKSWTPQYAANVLHRLECDVFPSIGAIHIGEVTHRELIATFRKIEARGAHEIAKRNKAVCGQIFSYAVQCGVASRNPVADMKDVLQPVTPGNFPAISVDQLPHFLAALASNEARMQPNTRIALRLLMLLFVRTSELIEAPWSELPQGVTEWIIPWQRMKMGRRRLNPIKVDHVVPLSRQARALIEELRSLTGGGNLLFPNLREHSRPMSDNAMLKAIERMGFKGDMSGHGFRALAMSAIKEKLGYRHEVVDRQLAHVPKDKNDKAYDRAYFLDERRTMMQEWSDYLDGIELRAVLLARSPAALDV